MLRNLVHSRILAPRLSALLLAALPLAVLASACAASLYPDAYVETTYVPAHIQTYPSTYYDGHPVYYVDGRWYYRSGPRWFYYRSAPHGLYRDYRYRSAPAYPHEREHYHLGAHDYGNDRRYDRDRGEYRHRHSAPPARERRAIEVR